MSNCDSEGLLSRLAIYICIVLLLTVAGRTAHADHATEQTGVKAQQTESNREVSGSGAHFVWILFKELQTDLEKHINRPIKLFGKGSMYGVGCNAGIKMAKRNSPEMETFGFVCCPLSHEEIEKNDLTVHPIALEPFLIITHESNPIESLTVKQIRQIFRGQITNWREVGGEDRKIIVVTRLHCGKRPGHWKTILPSKSDFRKERINVKGAEPMVRTVSDFSNSIGHVGSGWQIGPDDKIKIIKVDGYEPTPANLRSKKYPFYRQQSVVTHGQISPSVKAVIDFMKTSKEFKSAAEKYRMLPVQD